MFIGISFTREIPIEHSVCAKSGFQRSNQSLFARQPGVCGPSLIEQQLLCSSESVHLNSNPPQAPEIFSLIKDAASEFSELSMITNPGVLVETCLTLSSHAFSVGLWVHNGLLIQQ